MRTLVLPVLLAACAVEEGDPSALPLDLAPPPALDLDAGDLFVGQPFTIDLSGTLGEGETVYVIGGNAPALAGPCFPFLGGRCVGMRGPILLGTALVGPDGTASLTLTPPPTLTAGMEVALQAWVIRGYGGSSSLGSATVELTAMAYVPGCTDPAASNYDPSATVDDGSCIDPALYPFTRHTFTTCGAGGPTGPTLAACRASYAGAPWALDPALYTVTAGIQRWTVPESGTWRITAAGAQGGDTTASGIPGRGAVLSADFDLVAGEVLELLVGQQPGAPILNSGGGGGGTFVVRDDGTPLLVAGGGAGATSNSANGQGGRTTPEGGDSTSGQRGGAGGLGGEAGDFGTGNGSGGGGLLGDGEDGDLAVFGTRGGKAFVNGGVGGAAWDTTQRGNAGGFGGGGGCGNYGSGGGGGYSGGAAGASNGEVGGGGGSFSASAVNLAATADARTGQGYVIIERAP